jgi:S1-C subfamily serine protease
VKRLLPALLVGTLIVSLGGMPAFAKGPFGSISVGDWKGGAYTNDDTGAFTNCAAGAPFHNGLYLLLSHHVDSSWSLALANPAYNLTLGDVIPIDVTFDGQNKLHLFATVASPQGFAAIFPNNALSTLRKTRLMVIEVKGVPHQFWLTATDRVVAALANCVTKTKSAGVSNAGDFTVPVTSAANAKQAVQSSPSPSTSPNSTTPPKPAKIVGQTGTGFVVSTSGHVTTNYHVIDGCAGDIHGSLPGQTNVALRIVSTDETNDLALLQVPMAINEAAIIRATPIHSGDAIIAIGYPAYGLLTSDFTVTAGIVSSLSGPRNDTRFLQISASVQPGNSGGPLLDTSGNVVGVVTAKYDTLLFAKRTGALPENINFAVKTGAVRDFLDNSAVAYQTAEPQNELKTAEIARKARAYTMLISCSAKVKD